MSLSLQVKKTPCYDASGYEFYPVKNYDMNSSDWMWIPEEFESVFSEKGPFVKPAINSEGIMTGYSYVEKPLISQELLIGVVAELVEKGIVTLDAEGTPYISEMMSLLHPVEVEESVEGTDGEEIVEKESFTVESSDVGAAEEIAVESESENLGEENL